MLEFPRRGVRETRIDDIAKRSDINRRMIYYYFGSKEGLYLAALEQVYSDLTELERKIDVEQMDPIAAMVTLVNLKIDHYTRNPGFVAFLNMENLHRARHLRKSKKISEFRTPLTNIIGRVLDRGQKAGIFRKDVDPIDLYISICALGFFYFSNRYTLGVIFGKELDSPAALEQRKATIAEIITSYLRSSATAGRNLSADAVLPPDEARVPVSRARPSSSTRKLQGTA